MSEKYADYTGDKFVWVEEEAIKWISVSDELPDADLDVLLYYERHSDESREVAVANYDGERSWYRDGNPFPIDGCPMYWAEMPAGPEQ